MKCPKCGLVTFDHLAKCPKCQRSFRLARRLSRRGRDPNRKIVLPPPEPEAPPSAPPGPACIEPAGTTAAPAAADDASIDAGSPAEPSSSTLNEAVAAALDTATPQDFVPVDGGHTVAGLGDHDASTESGQCLAASERAAAELSGEGSAAIIPSPPPDDAGEPEAPAFRPVRAASVEAIRQIAESRPASADGPEPGAPAPAPEAPAPPIEPVANAEAFLPPGTPKPPRSGTASSESEPTARGATARGDDEGHVETADEAPATTHAADARRLKDRWMSSSRERRQERGDLMTDAVDPDLPDWYSPELEPEDDEADPGADSRPRKKRIRRRL